MLKIYILFPYFFKGYELSMLLFTKLLTILSMGKIRIKEKSGKIRGNENGGHPVTESYDLLKML